MRVGFVGLGTIGAHMARNLLDGGFEEVVVYDLRAEPCDALAREGAKVAGDLRELGARADVIGVCVRDDAEVEAVVCGEGGLLEGAARGTVLAIHSTVHPRTVQRLGERAADRGVAVIDAQISGGVPGTQSRSLTCMVGGEQAAVDRARPALETSSSTIFHCGGLGMGAIAKLCNNLLGWLGYTAGTEALLLARAAGLDNDVLMDVTRSTGHMTPAMAQVNPGRLTAEEHADDAEFQRFFGHTVALAEKDLAVTLDLARELGVALPASALARQLAARTFGLADPKRR
jgi:3-hydroxyisobutyrate dehydrogenase